MDLDIQQPVNSTFCQTASLEVYRGVNKAIEIDHTGFLMSTHGTLQVSIDILDIGNSRPWQFTP